MDTPRPVKAQPIDDTPFRVPPRFGSHAPQSKSSRLSVLACCAAVGVPAPPEGCIGIRAGGQEVDLSRVSLLEAIRKAATPDALQAVLALTWEARGASEKAKRRWREAAELRLGELRAAALVSA